MTKEFVSEQREDSHQIVVVEESMVKANWNSMLLSFHLMFSMTDPEILVDKPDEDQEPYEYDFNWKRETE